MRPRSRVPIYDLTVESDGDWAVSGGDIVLTADLETQVSQLLVDALETPFGQYGRLNGFQWGNEGIADDYSVATNDTVRYRLGLVLDDIEKGLGVGQPGQGYVKSIISRDIAFPGGNTFTVAYDMILADRGGTRYVHTITWNGATQQATVT